MAELMGVPLSGETFEMLAAIMSKRNVILLRNNGISEIDEELETSYRKIMKIIDTESFVGAVVDSRVTKALYDTFIACLLIKREMLDKGGELPQK